MVELLNFGANRLTGSIPARIGRLAKLGESTVQGTADWITAAILC